MNQKSSWSHSWRRRYKLGRRRAGTGPVVTAGGKKETAGATTKLRIMVGGLGGTMAGERRIPGTGGDRETTMYQETTAGVLLKGIDPSLPPTTKIDGIHKNCRTEDIMGMGK